MWRLISNWVWPGSQIEIWDWWMQLLWLDKGICTWASWVCWLWLIFLIQLLLGLLLLEILSAVLLGLLLEILSSVLLLCEEIILRLLSQLLPLLLSALTTTKSSWCWTSLNQICVGCDCFGLVIVRAFVNLWAVLAIRVINRLELRVFWNHRRPDVGPTWNKSIFGCAILNFSELSGVIVVSVFTLHFTIGRFCFDFVRAVGSFISVGVWTIVVVRVNLSQDWNWSSCSIVLLSWLLERSLPPLSQSNCTETEHQEKIFEHFE